jgi:hypothetical protein
MTGQNAFEQIVAFADQTGEPRSLISQDDYELWLKDVIWDCLHGIRFGQSFCNRFGISDNLLYYTTWPADQIDEYIKKQYLERT